MLSMQENLLECGFPLSTMGPLLREGNHIQVDFLASITSDKQSKFLKLLMNLTALVASLVFFKAGMEATFLYFNLGQMMELEIDIPIWWMYLSFPVGFIILASFSLELTVQAIVDLKQEKAKGV